MNKVFIISFLFLLSCNTKKSNSESKDLKNIALEIIHSAKNCALITVDSTGIAHARTMDPFLPEQNFEIWMATNPKSRKVNQIKYNPIVTLYYFDKENAAYVTLQGKATLINDSIKKEKYWKQDWENFYKNRKTDYLLIKFLPKKAFLISEKHKILGDSITWQSPEINF